MATHHRLRDLEPYSVYRLTASGTIDSKLAQRGPWIYAATPSDAKSGRWYPVGGPPPLERGLPLAGLNGRYGYTLSEAAYLPVGRVAERVCDIANWPTWWDQHRDYEDRAAEAVDAAERDKRSDTIWLVASLYALGYDVGGGQWDLGNEWARYVSHVLDMLPNQRRLTVAAVMDYATKARGTQGDAYIVLAEQWLSRHI